MGEDAKFYESVLRRFENQDDVQVVNLRVGEACGKGENFVSNVQRVFIEGFRKSKPYNVTVIAKVRSKSSMAQKFNFDQIFQNEVEAYQHILPALRRHSKSKLLSPQSMHLSHDLIILEDLASSGYKSLPKGHRFSLDESLMVLKELAKLHAASFSLQEREPERVQELKKLTTEIYRVDENEALEKSLRAQIKNALLVLDDPPGNAIARLKTLENSGYKRICDLFSGERKLSVFNHGDTWGSNILFRGEGGGGGTVRLVDFQMMRFTSVAADLSYFLYINLRPCDRRANFDELLKGYLEELLRHSEENGVSKEALAEMTMAWLKSELKDFRIFGFLCAIFILPVFYFTPEKIDVTQEEVEHVDFSLMTEEHKGALREYVLDFLGDLE